MSTSAISSATSSALETSSTSGYNSLGQDAFLKLLLTQLQNQDPMQPVEDKEFIAQLAQFSTLEQMQQLNANFAAAGQSGVATQAFSMIGKTIDYLSADTGLAATGKVDSVSFINGSPILDVGAAEVELGSVITVY